VSGDLLLVGDLGGTRMRVSIADSRGRILKKQAVPTPRDSPAELPRLMQSVIESAPGPLLGAVLGVPGIIDNVRSRIVDLPNLPGWAENVTAAGLSAALGLPVILANDADLAGLGEHHYGAGRGFEDMVYVTCSTGVGAAAIVNNRLLRGRHSLMEAGHTLLNLDSRDTVETLGSGTALLRATGRPGAEVAARALAGDKTAAEAFDRVARAFAHGVFNLVHLFYPQIVVVGGGMSQAGDLLLDPVRKLLAGCNASCPGREAAVVKASGGDDVGLLGAIAYWNSYGPGAGRGAI
jgi:glucokinase